MSAGPAIAIALAGAALVLVVLVVLVIELEKADRRADQYQQAYAEMLKGFVKAEADLTIAKMLHGGEIARLNRLLEQHDRA